TTNTNSMLDYRNQLSLLTAVTAAHFFFKGHGDHRDLHNKAHSFPTRRSSDLHRRRQRGQARLGILPQRLGHAPYQLGWRSEEHTSELQSRLATSYAVICLT